MERVVSFVLNGSEMRMRIEDHWTLLHLLREELGLLGTKEGCGSGECGACTVLVDGMAINACLYLAAEIDGKTVTSIEGLAAEDGALHPLQKAFVEHGGIQCGFCSPGMILSAKALLDEVPTAGEEEIKEAISGNICRCTGYVQIIESIRSVSSKAQEKVKVVAWQADEDE